MIDYETKMTAVAISVKAAELAKKEKDRRFRETGVKMTIGALVSEAVFQTFGSTDSEYSRQQ